MLLCEAACVFLVACPLSDPWSVSLQDFMQSKDRQMSHIVHFNELEDAIKTVSLTFADFRR